MEFLSNRFTILISLVCVIGLIFVGQLFNLQIVNGEKYREQSERRLVRETEMYAPRGNIYDRYGKVMVTSVTGYSVQIYRTKINSQQLNEILLEVAKILEKNGDEYYNDIPINFDNLTYSKSEDSVSSWLKKNKFDENMTAEEVINALKEKYDVDYENIDDVKKVLPLRYELSTNVYTSYKPVTLAKNISEESRMELEERNNELSGIYLLTQPIRFYETGSTASHVLGYIGKINSTEYSNKKDMGYSLNDYIGRSGIESSFESFLRGVNGSKRLEMDVYGRISNEEEIDESVMGDSVVLTIDLDLQIVTEKVLEEMIQKIQTGGFGSTYEDARTGAAIVMDVKSGEILSMASYPSYNPNDFIDGISNSEYEQYFNNKDRPMFNLAIQGTFSPGSTFKMITGIAGLESGAVEVDEKINDTGIYPLGHKPACWIWNSRRQTHGLVDAESALKVSCNYYYYELGSRMGIDVLAEWASKFGLGQKTGIELPGEVAGILASREYVQKLNVWTIGDTLSASIGQSYNTFTPLQMCYYIATLANRGVKNNVSIVKNVIKADGTIVDRTEVENVINEKLGIVEQDLSKIEIKDEYLDAIFEGMKSVTGDSGGTAYGTFKSFPIEVAGKTGTATAGSGDDNAWFVGFAPYDNPEIAVVVIVQHGGHGYYTAQAVKQIMEEYFGYNNDSINEDLQLKEFDIKLVQ